MPSADHARFVARARRESARYGGDPLVFVRELVQNARDAGASRVEFEVVDEPGGCRVSCRDDGSGMSEAHARRFLFRLYASSKGRAGEAGRFGVGFWSVLRFEPDRLTIRSRAAGHPAWELALDASLSLATLVQPDSRFAQGTEIALERDAPWPGLAEAVRCALREQVRDVRRRDRAGERLSIRQGGEELNAPLSMPPPCVGFEAGSERGVAGLGASPRVDVFSLGLRVRQAQTLDELVGGPVARPWCAVAGLAPTLALESARLSPLLSRADLREDAALRRLERRARGALRRLMDAELERLQPTTLSERLGRTLREWPGVSAFVVTLGLGLSLVAAIASPEGAGDGLRSTLPAPGAPALHAGPAATPGTTQAALTAELGADHMPGLEGLHDHRPALSLRYAPAEASPLLALRRTRAGRLLAGRATRPERSWVPPAATAPVVLSVRLLIHGGDRPVALPALAGTTPTRPQPGPQQLTVGDEGMVLARFRSGFEGWIEYSLVAQDEGLPGASPAQRLPPTLDDAARELRAAPAARRAEAAVAWVQATLRERRDAEAARLFAAAPGADFASRALAAGVGDCDVLNGVLALLLEAAEVPARLAVGAVGHQGRAVSGLHAWAEFHDGRRWHALDATTPVAVAVTSATTSRRSPAAPTDGPASGTLPPAASGSPPWLALGLAVASVLIVGSLVRRPVARTGATSLDELMRGALRHPEAFAAAPAVFDRPLLPRAGGGRVSLGAAWRAAASGRLYRTRDAARPLAAEARARRGIVLDDRVAVAALVADALGAVDLDRWEQRWQAARTEPGLERLTAAWAEGGLRAEVRLGPGDRLEALPFASRGPRARLLVGDRSPCWLAWRTAPGPAALLDLGTTALQALAAPEAAIRHALRPLARAALVEAAR